LIVGYVSGRLMRLMKSKDEADHPKVCVTGSRGSPPFIPFLPLCPPSISFLCASSQSYLRSMTHLSPSTFKRSMYTNTSGRSSPNLDTLLPQLQLPLLHGPRHSLVSGPHGRPRRKTLRHGTHNKPRLPAPLVRKSHPAHPNRTNQHRHHARGHHVRERQDPHRPGDGCG